MCTFYAHYEQQDKRVNKLIVHDLNTTDYVQNPNPNG